MACIRASDESLTTLELPQSHRPPWETYLSPISGRSTWINPFSWPQRFFEKKLIAKEWENSPRATTRFQTADQNGDINFLLNTEEEWASNKSHIDAVLDIFCGQTLLELQSPVASIPDDRKTALVIDGNINDPAGPHLRPFAGGLTSRELLRELRKKRYEETSSDNKYECEDGAKDDAERRLIFVENLDSWGVLALAGSAPESLSHVLGDLIANHVCSKSSIRVSFSTSGPPIFALHFDIPYRVWRYEQDFEDGFLTDPLCRGRYDVAQNGWDPRGYFIRVLEIRLVQVCREWASVVSNLEIGLRSLATSHKQMLKMMQDTRKQVRLTSIQVDDILQDFACLQERVSDAKDLLDDISLDLQETVRSGDSFMGTDVNYFLHNDGSPEGLLDCLPHLSQIRGVFNDLRHMQQRLGDWKHNYKEMVEEGFSTRKTLLLQLHAKASDQSVSDFFASNSALAPSDSYCERSSDPSNNYYGKLKSINRQIDIFSPEDENRDGIDSGTP
ncbi:hypothetical protein CGMCC3_g12527 [Colletotrichum fructicola]|uniref:Uncharacterized protein n=1 Tax=Colletotrichum fructicola (strain Nara gc5) TaxID=1213859 RepID=A0A7J6IIV4_COLFN|nr:uncharacterized protein CGMCC3_g12527 [Colletotrichum fructicola]KAE9571322.1 hypothetical protein CGMCC3_g12527 [Colletotrichum fructicola]KAF4476029.1 hypothetical protein CGGC5_v015239 [Colletotrichum fructicola Nara gc5]